MARHSVKAGMALVVALAAAGVVGCGSSESGSDLTCGAGTYNSGGVCVPKPWSDDGGAGGTGGSGGAGGTGGGLSCGAGTHESNGQCVADPVEAGLGCGTGTHEENGQCVADEAGSATVPGQVGDACTKAADCATSFCATPALNSRLVGGYCTVLACSDTNICPSGSACVDSGTGLKACFRYCDPGTDVCRDGYVCQPLSDTPELGICAPQCSADADCPAGGVCSLPDGMCTPPGTCDPAAPSCGTGKTCLPTSQSPTGGYCFPNCTAADECKTSEVCQPFGPGSAAGVCTPPACEANSDCPAGATCAIQHDDLTICQPPETCTDTCTATSATCVGGLCLASCASGSDGDTACKAIHPGLLCADAFGACMPACGTTGACDEGSSCFTTDWVCLPTGSFPTSPCLPSDTQHTTPYCLPIGSIDQECVSSGGQDICVPTCTADAQCSAISSALTCLESQGLCVEKCAPNTHACSDGYSCESTNDACLPTGAFPLSPCGPGDTCAANFDGAGDNLKCVSGTCLIDCATGGDTLCGALGTALGTALTCEDKALHACLPPCGDAPGFDCPAVGGASLSCFDAFGEKACLPTGSFPGSPCRTGAPECDIDLQGVDAFDMACFESSSSPSGVCLLTCNKDTDCSTFNASLACYEDKGACFTKCTSNADCGYPSTGMACLVSEGVCLPTGAFPGSPCKTGGTCDALSANVTQSCVNSTCVVDCNDSAVQTGDGLCQAVNSALTCMPTNPATGAGSCVYACQGGMCPTGYSCYEPEGTQSGAQNACLPNGSFPGGACATGNSCGSYAGKTMTCASSTCVITCSTEADCSGIGLTCLDASHVCVQPCSSGTCDDNRYACYETENACLPKGSFPFGPCNASNTCSSYGPLPMACTAGTCLISCSDASNGDAVCAGVNAALTCENNFVHACMPACQSGQCLTGYSCEASQGACLPTGTFPGSACRSAEPKCDENLGGNPALDMVCVSDACVLDCSWNSAICASFGLACTPVGGGSICM